MQQYLSMEDGTYLYSRKKCLDHLENGGFQISNLILIGTSFSYYKT